MFQGKLVVRPAVYDPDKGLRHADNSDVHNVWALLGGYARESLLLPRTEEDIQEKIGNFRIAELDGKFVGCVALRHYGNSLYEVRSFAVAKPYVGQGIGSEMLSGSMFPGKIWSDCVICKKKDNCDETAVLMEFN